jgi:hypothetical protein
MGGDLHLISARANSLELLGRISGAEFMIFAFPCFLSELLAAR